MRAYFFGNMYLSSIQQGIQAAHVVTHMFRDYRQASKRRKMLYEWANKHKTMVLLNGGGHRDLLNLVAFLDVKQNPYPWAMFAEDEESLNLTITSVGVILPEQVYEAAKLIREDKNGEAERFAEEGVIDLMIDGKYRTGVKFTWWVRSLIERINSCPLAH
jgi:hypothetical protein